MLQSGAHELCQPAPPSSPPSMPRAHHKLCTARDEADQQQAVLERARVAHGLGRGSRGRLRVRVEGLPVAGALREHAHQRRRREAEHARDARVQRVGGRAQVARDHLRTSTGMLCTMLFFFPFHVWLKSTEHHLILSEAEAESTCVAV